MKTIKQLMDMKIHKSTKWKEALTTRGSVVGVVSYTDHAGREVTRMCRGPCHGFIRSIHKPDYLITIPRELRYLAMDGESTADLVQYERFVNWFLQESPFRFGFLNKSYSSVKKIGWVHNMKQSRDDFIFTSILSRAPQEAWRLSDWCKLVDEGNDPLAVFIALHFVYDGSLSSPFRITGYSDQVAFDPRYTSIPQIRKLVATGKMERRSSKDAYGLGLAVEKFNQPDRVAEMDDFPLDYYILHKSGSDYCAAHSSPAYDEIYNDDIGEYEEIELDDVITCHGFPGCVKSRFMDWDRLASESKDTVHYLVRDKMLRQGVTNDMVLNEILAAFTS